MPNGKRSITLTIGWIMLFVLGLLMTLGGLESLYVAYRAADNPIAGVSLARFAELNPEIPAALRGRRSTAASLAISYGILLAWIAAVPFRRAERWSWCAVGVSFAAGSLSAILRVPLLDTWSGAGSAAVALGIAVVALAISSRDFFG